jgi:transposase
LGVILLVWELRCEAEMRGSDGRSGSLFSYVDLEARVPRGHPLRSIRQIANGALSDLSGDFAAMYARLGRPSIAPEKLLRASLLQAFYSVRSERQLMERLEFDLLFRWFVGLGIDDPVWDHSVFSKNRDRLLEGEIAAKFLAAVLAQPHVKQLLSSDHFSVDGTLVEAWASMKSLKPRDGGGGSEPPAGVGRNAEVDFRGEKRGNDTHASTSDPDALLYRKGAGMEAKLCFIGHALMENRHGLLIDTRLTRVSGHAERLAALDMIASRADRPQAITLGGDKGFDAADFVMELREINVTPHIARNTSRRSAIDVRTTRHPGYAISQRIRKRIEEGFGWMKTVAGLRKTKYRGLDKVGWTFTFAAAAYNLIRLPKLMTEPG